MAEARRSEKGGCATSQDVGQGPNVGVNDIGRAESASSEPNAQQPPTAARPDAQLHCTAL